MLCTFESNLKSFINLQFSIFLEDFMNIHKFGELYTNGILPEFHYNLDNIYNPKIIDSYFKSKIDN